MAIGPERQRQRSVVQWARMVLPIGSKVFAVDNEAAPKVDPMLRKEEREKQVRRYGAARRKSGILTGFPDLGVILPGGASCWIEMKDVGGLVSSVQQDMHDDLRAVGHHVGVATDIDTCRRLFIWWGIMLREPPGQPTPQPKVRYARREPRLVDDAVPL